MRTMNVLVAIVLLSAGIGSAFADTAVNETRPAPKEGTVRINNIAGSIDVKGWDKEEVAVTGTLAPNVERLDITSRDGTTSIEVVNPKPHKHVQPSRLQVSMPASSRVECEAVSADIKVQDVAGEVQAHTVSGDIDVAGPTPRVIARTVSGTSTVKAGAAEVVTESVSGDTDVTSESGSLRASTVSGEVRTRDNALKDASVESMSGPVRFEGGLQPGAKLDINSFSGSVDCVLPPATTAEVDFDSFSGSMDATDFGIDRAKNLTTTIGSEGPRVEVGGEARIRINTFSGSARLRKP
jgi:DUF4097 and DUF4098 domain-containing protein YvlB